MMPILRGLAACAIVKRGVKANAAPPSIICLRFIDFPPARSPIARISGNLSTAIAGRNEATASAPVIQNTLVKMIIVHNNISVKLFAQARERLGGLQRAHQSPSKDVVVILAEGNDRDGRAIVNLRPTSANWRAASGDGVEAMIASN